MFFAVFATPNDLKETIKQNTKLLKELQELTSKLQSSSVDSEKKCYEMKLKLKEQETQAALHMQQEQLRFHQV